MKLSKEQKTQLAETVILVILCLAVAAVILSATLKLPKP